MALKLKTSPVAEPIDLPALKEFLRIDADDTTFDAELSAIAGGVRADAEAITGRALIEQTWELHLDAFTPSILLPKGPVREISSIAYYDLNGELQTAATELYDVDLASDPQWVVLRAGASWPATLQAVNAVIVTFVAGYGAAGSDLPKDLYAALLRAARGQFDGKPVELDRLLINHRTWL